MNYAELFAAIQSYTENTFPSTVIADGSVVSYTTQINTIIQQAEQRIYSDAPLAAARKDATLTLTPSSEFATAPDDFLYVFSMAVVDDAGAYNYLLVKDQNFIREAYPNPSVTGVPRYYAIHGQRTGTPKELRFIFGPTPGAAYPVNLQYFAYPESIVTAGTTWLGDNFDTALLYACLLEAAVFMKADADMLAAYGSRYQEAMAQLKQLANGDERGDKYRNGQAKMPVV